MFTRCALQICTYRYICFVVNQINSSKLCDVRPRDAISDEIAVNHKSAFYIELITDKKKGHILDT